MAIKVNNKAVNKIMINGKEVLKVVINGDTKYQKATAVWNPTDLVFDSKTNVTSTSSVTISNSANPYIYFIYPAQNTVYLNSTGGTNYKAFFILYDALNKTIVLFNHDSNGVLTTQEYSNITTVVLPAQSSSTQTSMGRHRYSRYINNSGKTLKWSVLNSYVYIANGSAQTKTICDGTNQNADINLNILEDVTNVNDYSKYTTFIISPYINSTNQYFYTQPTINAHSYGSRMETSIYAQKTSTTEYSLITEFIGPTDNKTNTETRTISSVDTLQNDSITISPTTIYSQSWTYTLNGKGCLVLRVTTI